ncbi:hypothetical protein C7S13_5223 [Burkholderia cepacia]|nr:hypothetical protein [Burkholderia cepacia]
MRVQACAGRNDRLARGHDHAGIRIKISTFLFDPDPKVE